MIPQAILRVLSPTYRSPLTTTQVRQLIAAYRRHLRATVRA